MRKPIESHSGSIGKVSASLPNAAKGRFPGETDDDSCLKPEVRPMTMHAATGTISQQMRDCIQACRDCAETCLETVRYCLEQGGRHAEASHIALLLDCAQICQTSADFMTRGSALHQRICAACAEVCERCAESCEAFGDDQQMRACAEACRRCADSCRQMAGMTA
jgi:hypothetical protein